MEDANLYHSKKEWERKSPKFYHAAHRNGWLDECCSHMKDGRNQFSAEENKFIKTNAGKKTLKEMSVKLNRPTGSISRQAEKLKISLRIKRMEKNKYDYSLLRVDFPDQLPRLKDVIRIICPLHGIFNQKYVNHKYGKHGCQKCNKVHRPTTEEFIEKAMSIHNGVYDYSKFFYINAKTKGCIICNKHGEFFQNPNNHLNGNGCPKCSNNLKLTFEDFIDLANKKHNNTYKYSTIVLKSVFNKVEIFCKNHGKFIKSVKNHLGGEGCPFCSGRVPTGHWSIKRNCILDAKKYNKKSLWVKSSIGAYTSAKKYGWFDEATKHMKNERKK
jgi:hypothetical protein